MYAFLMSILCTILALGLAMMIAQSVEGIVNARKERRLQRLRNLQLELSRTQTQLQILASQHKAWLNEQAHEARKALIIESFVASQEGREHADSNRYEA